MKLARSAALIVVAVVVLAMGTGAGAATYSNTTPTTIPSAGPATPYPSTIAVSGALGTIMDVNVKLTMSHTWPDDVDVLLAGPNGTRIVLMSDAGGSLDINSVNLTFDDAATVGLPDFSQITSGTYDATNFIAGDVFPAPAPTGPPATALAAFNGTDANGVWKLFVVDDLGGDVGVVSSWSLDIRSCLLPEVVAVTDTTPAAPVVSAVLCS